MTPSLTLHFYPLSSYCQKVLFGLYDLDIPFRKRIVDLMDDADRSEFLELWPLGKFPVLRDDARGLTVPETSIILEYVEARCSASRRLIASDPDLARECRLRDRFFDLYVNDPMGKIVTDKLRPEHERDRYGVAQARTQLETAYRIADDWMRQGPWAVGDGVRSRPGRGEAVSSNVSGVRGRVVTRTIRAGVQFSAKWKSSRDLLRP